jgi:transposase-like protein
VTAPASERCPRCGQVKPAGEFYRRRRGRRLSPYCQPCQRAATREAASRRRQDPASAALLRAVDRTRQRRRRALRGQPPRGGAIA